MTKEETTHVPRPGESEVARLSCMSQPFKTRRWWSKSGQVYFLRAGKDGCQLVGKGGAIGMSSTARCSYVLKAAAVVIGLSAWPGTECTVAVGDAKCISCSR